MFIREKVTYKFYCEKLNTYVPKRDMTITLNVFLSFTVLMPYV